jgi:hypothetical protein
MPKLAVVGSSTKRQIARPIKILAELIKKEINLATEAGIEHYLNAGELLIEAKDSDQVARGAWGGWLSRNFKWSQSTANRWMRAARRREEFDENDPENIEEIVFGGAAETIDPDDAKARKKRHDKARAIMDAIGALDTEAMVLERQTINEEIQLHRDIAVQLIDLGYRAMAMRLHPDKGGSKEAMSRLTTVRDELKPIAAKRRYI